MLSSNFLRRKPFTSDNGSSSKSTAKNELPHNSVYNLSHAATVLNIPEIRACILEQTLYKQGDLSKNIGDLKAPSLVNKNFNETVRSLLITIPQFENLFKNPIKVKISLSQERVSYDIKQNYLNWLAITYNNSYASQEVGKFFTNYTYIRMNVKKFINTFDIKLSQYTDFIINNIFDITSAPLRDTCFVLCATPIGQQIFTANKSLIVEKNLIIGASPMLGVILNILIRKNNYVDQLLFNHFSTLINLYISRTDIIKVFSKKINSQFAYDFYNEKFNDLMANFADPQIEKMLTLSKTEEDFHFLNVCLYQLKKLTLQGFDFILNSYMTGEQKQKSHIKQMLLSATNVNEVYKLEKAKIICSDEPFLKFVKENFRFLKDLHEKKYLAILQEYAQGNNNSQQYIESVLNSVNNYFIICPLGKLSEILKLSRLKPDFDIHILKSLDIDMFIISVINDCYNKSPFYRKYLNFVCTDINNLGKERINNINWQILSEMLSICNELNYNFLIQYTDVLSRLDVSILRVILRNFNSGNEFCRKLICDLLGEQSRYLNIYPNKLDILLQNCNTAFKSETIHSKLKFFMSIINLEILDFKSVVSLYLSSENWLKERIIHAVENNLLTTDELIFNLLKVHRGGVLYIDSKSIDSQDIKKVIEMSMLLDRFESISCSSIDDNSFSQLLKIINTLDFPPKISFLVQTGLDSNYHFLYQAYCKERKNTGSKLTINQLKNKLESNNNIHLNIDEIAEDNSLCTKLQKQESRQIFLQPTEKFKRQIDNSTITTLTINQLNRAEYNIDEILLYIGQHINKQGKLKEIDFNLMVNTSYQVLAQFMYLSFANIKKITLGIFKNNITYAALYYALAKQQPKNLLKIHIRSSGDTNGGMQDTSFIYQLHTIFPQVANEMNREMEMMEDEITEEITETLKRKSKNFNENLFLNHIDFTQLSEQEIQRLLSDKCSLTRVKNIYVGGVNENIIVMLLTLLNQTQRSRFPNIIVNNFYNDPQIEQYQSMLSRADSLAHSRSYEKSNHLIYKQYELYKYKVLNGEQALDTTHKIISQEQLQDLLNSYYINDITTISDDDLANLFINSKFSSIVIKSLPIERFKTLLNKIHMKYGLGYKLSDLKIEQIGNFAGYKHLIELTEQYNYFRRKLEQSDLSIEKKRNIFTSIDARFPE